MSVNLPLLSINKSILTAKTPTSSPLRLLISSSKRNLKKGVTVTHLEIKGLRVKLIFNKNIIELGNNKEYIKEAVDAITILYVK